MYQTGTADVGPSWPDFCVGSETVFSLWEVKLLDMLQLMLFRSVPLCKYIDTKSAKLAF